MEINLKYLKALANLSASAEDSKSFCGVHINKDEYVATNRHTIGILKHTSNIEAWGGSDKDIIISRDVLLKIKLDKKIGDIGILNNDTLIYGDSTYKCLINCEFPDYKRVLVDDTLYMSGGNICTFALDRVALIGKVLKEIENDTRVIIFTSQSESKPMKVVPFNPQSKLTIFTMQLGLKMSFEQIKNEYLKIGE